LNRFVSTLIEDTSGTAGVNAPGLGDQGRYHVDLSYERGFSARSFGFAGATYDQLTYSNTFNVPNISGRARVGGSHLVHPQWLVGANAEGTFGISDVAVLDDGSFLVVTNLFTVAPCLVHPNRFCCDHCGVRHMGVSFAALRVRYTELRTSIQSCKSR